jgi:peptide/nickel transport system substrate-binding protein
VATAGGGRELVGSGPYLWSAPNDGPDGKSDRAELRAAKPPGPEAGVKIRRVREFRYPNAAAALGAFNRGEVALVERVPPDRVAELAKNAEFKVGRYARPSLHRIALDGRTPALRNRTLRRGLSYAIDRRTLLEETLLRRPPDAVNLVSDGVFPKGSYADAPDVKPLAFEPWLARGLVAAAKKELGNQPIELTFEYPAVPEAQAVAPKLVDALKGAGVVIKAVERPESELESELRSGRRFDLAYRVSRVEEPIVNAGPLLTPAYDASPSTDPLGSLASPRILQLLLLLERAPEFPTAKGLAVQIDRECRDELPVLPLWQLEDHYAWHVRLKGPAEQAERLYDGLTTWEVEPWFAKDPW